jgi:hypothetical protein
MTLVLELYRGSTSPTQFTATVEGWRTHAVELAFDRSSGSSVQAVDRSYVLNEVETIHQLFALGIDAEEVRGCCSRRVSISRLQWESTRRRDCMFLCSR